MTKNELRRIIRSDAEARDCAYRITQCGEVHYYGRMPNSTVTGWYLMAQDAAMLAREIKAGQQ